MTRQLGEEVIPRVPATDVTVRDVFSRFLVSEVRDSLDILFPLEVGPQTARNWIDDGLGSCILDEHRPPFRAILVHEDRAVVRGPFLSAELAELLRGLHGLRMVETDPTTLPVLREALPLGRVVSMTNLLLAPGCLSPVAVLRGRIIEELEPRNVPTELLVSELGHETLADSLGRSVNPRRDWLWYQVDGAIVAGAGVVARSSLFHEIAVVTRPETRLHGHGASVVSALIQRRVHSAGAIAVAQTPMDNQAGLGLAQSLGFRTAPGRPCWVRNPDGA